MAQFESGVEFLGNPGWGEDYDFRAKRPGWGWSEDIIVHFQHGQDRTVGLDRDEVQTLVDFLIEVLEETEPGLR